MAQVLITSIRSLPFTWLIRWLQGPELNRGTDPLELRNEEMRRLEATAPHLLDDIGMAGRAPKPTGSSLSPVRGALT